MPRCKTPKPWSVADVNFVEVEISHPRERQMQLLFENGIQLTVGDDSQIPLAAELITHLRKLECTRKGDSA